MTFATDDDAPLPHEEQAAEWCLRLADRPLTDDEREEYEAWLKADPRHQQALDKMVTVWEYTDAIAGMPRFLSLRAKALSTMESARDSGDTPPYGSRIFAAAAAALVLMILGGVWLLANKPTTYATDVGERLAVRLEDGSNISLDALSEIAVSYTDDRRKIVLDHGRAKFEVAKDSLRPFTVTAGERTVVATGTAFSVELLQDEVRVLLYEGQVEVLTSEVATSGFVRTETPRQASQLEPGEELVANISSGATRVVPLEEGRSLSWEEGQLDFIGEPLATAVQRVNRYSDTPIVIGDAAVARYRVNGVFHAGDTQSFVTGVTMLYPITAVRDEERITLFSDDMALAKESEAQK